MASSKLSALTAITTAGDDDLIYVADTADGGSTYASKRITRGNLFSAIATESYVTTAISNLVDGAPGALDTLNELAAAMGDDANLSTTLTNLINANETHIDNVATLTGVAKDATGLGTFTGSTISDASDIKTALQDLETAAESAAAGSAVADQVKTVTNSTNADQYITFVNDDNASLTTEAVRTDAGVKYNPALNLLTVGGRVHALNLTLDSVNVTATAAELNILDGVTSTAAELNILDGVTSTAAELNILDGVTSTAAEINLLDGVTATTAELNYVDGVTSAIQTQLDAKTADGDNVNNLVGSTSADSVPQDSGADNYLFLVVDKSNGAIKAIDKTFIEAEG